MRTRRNWSPEQDAKLIGLVTDPIHKRSIQDIADAMERPKASVKHRAKRLGYPNVGRFKTPRYNDAFIDQIVQWRKDGLTLREIGGRLGLTKANVSAILSSRGRQRQINRWTPKEDEWIKTHYPNRAVKLDGLPGRTSKAVNHRAKHLGIKRPKGIVRGTPGHKRLFDEAEVCQRYREMKSLQKVALFYKAAAQTIARVLKRNGVTPKPYSRFNAQRDAIIADYREGKLSMLEMEAKYGFSCDEMRAKLKDCGEYDPKRASRFVSHKSVRDCWIESFGKEEGDKRWTEYVAKRKRTARRGKNSPSYGKPSPQGSGNGWKGWYRDHYFRSLREACCMIEMDCADITWQTGETLSIPYVFRDTERTYRPDYIVDNHLIEVKPTRLHNSPSVSAKHQGALVYCQDRGLTYELVDVSIDPGALYTAWTAGLLRFDRDYEARFLAYTGAHNGLAFGLSSTISAAP